MHFRCKKMNSRWRRLRRQCSFHRKTILNPFETYGQCCKHFWQKILISKQLKNRRQKYDACRRTKMNREVGCRHSSVDSSAPTILLPLVRVPSTPSMLYHSQSKLFHIYLVKRTKIDLDHFIKINDKVIFKSKLSFKTVEQHYY